MHFDIGVSGSHLDTADCNRRDSIARHVRLRCVLDADRVVSFLARLVVVECHGSCFAVAPADLVGDHLGAERGVRLQDRLDEAPALVRQAPPVLTHTVVVELRWRSSAAAELDAESVRPEQIVVDPVPGVGVGRGHRRYVQVVGVGLVASRRGVDDTLDDQAGQLDAVSVERRCGVHRLGPGEGGSSTANCVVSRSPSAGAKQSRRPWHPLGRRC